MPAPQCSTKLEVVYASLSRCSSNASSRIVFARSVRLCSVDVGFLDSRIRRRQLQMNEPARPPDPGLAGSHGCRLWWGCGDRKLKDIEQY